METLSESGTRARQRVASAQRIVIKLGTNVIMRDDGAAAVGLLYGLVESVVNIRRDGKEVLLVSSGAIAIGARHLGLRASAAQLAVKQACAAVGQSRLMALYEEAFGHFDITTAQVLLTEDDFLDPVRYSNLRATLDTLLKLGVLPIVNENDTVSTLELDRPSQASSAHRVFGDNDKLSALVMTKVEADLLILLSDVNGLYTGHPSEADAEFVAEVDDFTPELVSFAKEGNGRGRGGMTTKIEAARIVSEHGRVAVIANGRTPGILESVCAGENVGTVFAPQGTR
ncbi:MAG TPA: glutamate 5-kinase [Acidisarcina sp.]|nr:glutamate 5-kinase [Acidisarcina sp.]